MNEEGVGNSGENRERKAQPFKEREVVTLWGKEKSLRKQKCAWVSECRTTHSRKPKAHDTNKLWAWVEVGPNSHILGTHKNLLEIVFEKICKQNAKVMVHFSNSVKFWKSWRCSNMLTILNYFSNLRFSITHDETVGVCLNS